MLSVILSYKESALAFIILGISNADISTSQFADIERVVIIGVVGILTAIKLIYDILKSRKDLKKK